MLFACSKNTAKVQECLLLIAIVLATCSKSAMCFRIWDFPNPCVRLRCARLLLVATCAYRHCIASHLRALRSLRSRPISMELFDDLDAAYGAHEFEAWEPRNRNKMLVKMSTALLPHNLATAIPDLGPKRENGEWVSTWERFTDRHLDLFTIYDASQKRIPGVFTTITRRSHK